MKYAKRTIIAYRRAQEEERARKQQLCWICKNACGGCSWSRAFKPVEGWMATPTIILQEDNYIKLIPSYHITACPEFKHYLTK